MNTNLDIYKSSSDLFSKEDFSKILNKKISGPNILRTNEISSEKLIKIEEVKFEDKYGLKITVKGDGTMEGSVIFKTQILDCNTDPSLYGPVALQKLIKKLNQKSTIESVDFSKE